MGTRVFRVLLLAGFVLADEPAPKQLLTGFRFTEGPAADAQGNVYFTDIPNQRIHRVGLDGTLSTFRENSGHANGLMFNGNGELVACEGGNGRVVAISRDGKTVRVLADKYEGKRFNAPNDLVIDRWGGVYFTDPEFGRAIRKPQGTFAVYYIAAPGNVTRVIESLPKPNGIMLSPDEKTLYVACSGGPDVMAYPVDKPGKLGTGCVFFRLLQPEGKDNTGGDGLTVDIEGNLYFTTWLGIQVVSPEGIHLRTLTFPEKPANVTLGGKDGKTLYVTARTSVYTLPIGIEGHRFAVDFEDFKLGLRYRNGDGVRVDHRRALRHFDRAVAVGCRDAVFWRSFLILQSQVLDENRSEARSTLKKLASQGDRNAVVLPFLHDMYEADYRSGVYVFVEQFARPWVAAGDADAELAYAEYVRLHLGQQSRALKLARRAAEQGHVEAQYLLGSWLLDARVAATGDRENELLLEAKKWFELAAFGGHARAAREMSSVLGTLRALPEERVAWFLLWERIRSATGSPLDASERRELDGVKESARNRKVASRAKQMCAKLWKRTKPGVQRRVAEITARTGKKP